MDMCVAMCVAMCADVDGGRDPNLLTVHVCETGFVEVEGPNMCVDMCVDRRIYMCIDTCRGMHIGICTDMGRDMRIDMNLGMGKNICGDMSNDKTLQHVSRCRWIWV